MAVGDVWEFFCPLSNDEEITSPGCSSSLIRFTLGNFGFIGGGFVWRVVIIETSLGGD